MFDNEGGVSGFPCATPKTPRTLDIASLEDQDLPPCGSSFSCVRATPSFLREYRLLSYYFPAGPHVTEPPRRLPCVELGSFPSERIAEKSRTTSTKAHGRANNRRTIFASIHQPKVYSLRYSWLKGAITKVWDGIDRAVGHMENIEA